MILPRSEGSWIECTGKSIEADLANGVRAMAIDVALPPRNE